MVLRPQPHGATGQASIQITGSETIFCARMGKITEQGPETAHNIKEAVLVPQKLQGRPPLQTTMSLQHANLSLQRRNEELAVLGALYNDGPPHHLLTTMPNATSQRQVEYHESGASPAIGRTAIATPGPLLGPTPPGLSSPRTNGIVPPDGGIREDQRCQDDHLPPPGRTPQPRWTGLGR